MTTYDHLSQFTTTLKRRMQRAYDRSVNKDLSKQQWQDLFIRNISLVLKQAYKESLAEIRQLETETSSTAVLPLFEDFIDELMSYALHKHRTSCALSNFPDEHKPSQDYIAETLQQAQLDWDQFCAETRNILS